VLRSGRGALHLVLDRMRTRTFRAPDAKLFANINTPADYARFCAGKAQSSGDVSEGQA
jgi:molybdopterin-guanine dinucleotide biosynthesis protein A